MREDQFIEWLRGETRQAGVPMGPGDDCAVVNSCAFPQLLTTDMLMEGVDFILAEAGARAVGRKAMAVNLSDIAAMAGTPTAALVSVCFPRTVDISKELFLGMQEVADRFHVPIVGGDTNSWDGGLVVSISILGHADPSCGPILRSGAKPGDCLFVTGPLGGSILGRHLNPEPRIELAKTLVHKFPIHAMMDISDGLAIDLSKLIKESRCGAELISSEIPIHTDALTLARETGRPPIEHALGDGEDFELLFAVPPDVSDALIASGLATFIGRCVESGLWIEHEGNRRILTPTGWQHTFG